MARIEELLDEQIVEALSEWETSSQDEAEEKQAALDAVETLYRLRIEEKKVDLDAEEKRERRRMDAEQAKADRRLKRWLGIGEIAVPAVLYAVLSRTCLKFEETGTISSSVFKGLLRLVRPEK